ncbi:hypothetical protein WJX79_003521 [Trebouxia sp. C0005]
MTSKIYRTAGSIKNGTVAAASYAGSTLAYVAPQMAGAIDIMVVSQPDGSLRSSPFYVRFGKYTGLRTADKKVHLVVNDVEADFAMHLGRSGEAYFVGEDDVVGDSDDEGELLAGMMSPPNGYSSADEALSYATPEQTASIQAAVAKLGQAQGLDIQAAADKRAASEASSLRPSHSTSLLTDILSVPASMDTSLSAPPGDPTFTLTPKHPAGKSRLNLTKTLDKPPLAPKPLVTDEPLTSFGLGSPGGVGQSSHAIPKDRGGKSGSLDSVAEASESPLSTHQAAAGSAQTSGQRSDSQSHSPASAHSHLTEDLAAAMQQEEERRASHAQAESSSSSPAKTHRNGFLFKLVGSSNDGKGSSGQQQPASTPFQLASQQLLQEKGPASPDLEPATNGTEPHGFSHADDVQSADPVLSTDVDQQAQHDQQKHEHIGGSPSEVADRLINSLQGLGSSNPDPAKSSEEEFSFQAPTHPWSVSNPRFLATPTASQPPTLTMHASAAAAPVGPGSASASSSIPPAQHMAMSQPASEANTAIPAIVPDAQDSEDGSPHAGNRIELEAMHDQLFRKGQTAQMAMYEAHKERREWDHAGGTPPVHSHYGQEVAVGGDLAAAQAASKQAEAHPQSDSGSNSSVDQPDPSGSAGRHENGLTSAHIGCQGGLTSANHLGTSHPRTPMSPQPARHPHPVLTRQLSKSAPNSPRSFSKLSLPATQDITSKATTADAQAQRTTAERRDLPGSILIPGRALGSVQVGSGSMNAGSEGVVEGVSPPDGYMADSEHSWSRHRLQSSSVSFNDSGRLLRAGSSGAGRAGDGWASLAGFEISLCGPHVIPSLSPEEAYEVFQTHKVSEAQFAEQGPLLISKAGLMCRLGDRVYPWQEAAPVVMGVLAFGGDWQHFLPAEGGLPVAVPSVEAQHPQQDARKAKVAKSSSWRVWLGSWRSSSTGAGRNGKPGSGSLDAAVAAAAAATHPRSPAAQQLALEALESGLSPQAASMVSELVASQQGRPPPGRRRAFVPSPAQLKALPLQYGQNTIDFTFAGQRLRAYIHYFNWNSRLVISDIDGTITKSDLLGHLLPRVGFDWSHRGVTRLFTNIKANGYVFMFLSSRAIAQASATRDYLHTLNQDGETLPAGPVIISPDGLFPSLYRELVLRRPHEFKISASSSTQKVN